MRLPFLLGGLFAIGCMPTTATELAMDATPTACPGGWVVEEDGLAALPDISEELYLPTPQAGPPSAKDKAYARSVLSDAPGWCTAHTTAVTRAYVVDPGPETLHWHGRFMLYEMREPPAHAAFAQFLRSSWPNDALRAFAEKEMPILEQHTARIGIVCDAPAVLEEIDGRYVDPFPLEATGKHLVCPLRASLRVSNRRAIDLVAKPPGCPPVKITIAAGQRDAVIRLR